VTYSSSYPEHVLPGSLYHVHLFYTWQHVLSETVPPEQKILTTVLGTFLPPAWRVPRLLTEKTFYRNVYCSHKYNHKHSRTANEEWSSSLGLDVRLTTRRRKNQHVTNCYTGSRSLRFSLTTWVMENGHRTCNLECDEPLYATVTENTCKIIWKIYTRLTGL
jgi:hypothetical protein